MRHAVTPVFFIALMIFASCSVLTKNNPDNDVVIFLQKFEKDLAESDTAALRLFDATQSQSRSSIITALHELRSPNRELIECSVDFQKPVIVSDSLGMRAIVDVFLKSSKGDSEQVPLTFWFSVRQGEYSIKLLDAKQFHSRYSRLQYEASVANELAESSKLLKPYVDAASRLQNTYDSVVWFSTYALANAAKDSAYYYVINGSWKQPAWDDTLNATTYKMGLVSNSGNVLVPVKFDLIGSPGALWKDMVEVQTSGKVGYYSLTGKEIVPPKYDRIIPYSAGDARAIVKLDTMNGWLDHEFVFHEGYPSAASKEFMTSYKFLATKITVKDSLYTLCRIPDPHYLESGSVVMPKYLVDYGLFKPVISDIIYRGFGHLSEYYSEGTEFIEKGSFDILDLSGNMKLLITAFKGRYIGGREEFYQDTQLTLVSQSSKPSSAKQWGEQIEVRQLNDSILEIKSYSSEEWEPNEYGCLDMPYFSHYRISSKGLQPIQVFGQTGFTKYALLDSSYFVGTFTMMDIQTGEKTGTISFAPQAYLQALQSEILAANGYIFPDAVLAEPYIKEKWYKQLTGDYDLLLQNASAQDQHNLKFLETIVGRPQGGSI